jgi:hypothetical protein
MAPLHSFRRHYAARKVSMQAIYQDAAECNKIQSNGASQSLENDVQAMPRRKK